MMLSIKSKNLLTISSSDKDVKKLIDIASKSGIKKREKDNAESKEKTV